MVALAAVLLVSVPVAVRHRPGGGPPTAPSAELLARIQSSGDVGWSGRATSQGSLALPSSESFATLGQLLGECLDRGSRAHRRSRSRSIRSGSRAPYPVETHGSRSVSK